MWRARVKTAMQAVAHAFKNLATQTNTIMKQAAAIVGCVKNRDDGHGAFQGAVSLCLRVSSFLGKRWTRPRISWKTLKFGEKLLDQFNPNYPTPEEGVASHLKALSVLTNVEVSHLGMTRAMTSKFLSTRSCRHFQDPYLSRPYELANQTENRKQAMGQTRRDLGNELPQLRNENDSNGGRCRENPASDRRWAWANWSRIPEQFRVCTAANTSEQISGVVAAIQSHDITRQQLEHIQESASDVLPGIDKPNGLPVSYAGLSMQIHQLKTIKKTLANWTIPNCAVHGRYSGA